MNELKVLEPQARGRVGKPIPGNNPVKAPADTKKPPYWFMGQLTMTFPDGTTAIGSATLIAAKDKKQTGLYVLTCAHNLYQARYGGKATSVTFQRALNAPAQPYGAVNGAAWSYPANYPENALSHTVNQAHVGAALLGASSDLDYGLVQLASKIDVADCPVMTALADGELDSLAVQLIGLYGYDELDDDCMYVGTGSINVVSATEVGYPISTKTGSSGTSVMADGHLVVAVHTHAGLDGDLHNYGRRLTPAVINEIQGWQV